MKKVILLAFTCLITLTATSQNDTTKVKEKTKLTGYTSLGFSTSNGNDFNAASYVAVEAGAMYGNVSLGAIFGRGNLVGFGKKNDVLGNYYYEFKAAGYVPISGPLSANVIFGWGGYFNSNHRLIEYGAGLSYTVRKFGYGVTYSNWDGVNYVTPSITFNF